MLKMYFKLKKYLKDKGFTLVELIAIIVIIAIIMLIAIPSILSVLESTRVKTFQDYVEKSAGLAQKQLAEDNMNELNDATCIMYNIKTDLGLGDTGSFEGWILINNDTDDVYITLFNDDYAITAFHYSDQTLKVKDYMKKKSAFTEEELTINYLCGKSSCSECTYKDEDGSKIVDNEEFKYKNGAYLVSGTTLNLAIRHLYDSSIDYKRGSTYNLKNDSKIKSIQKSNIMPDNSVEIIDVSTSESPNRVYIWKDDSTVYFYTDAIGDIYMNSYSSSAFFRLTALESLDITMFNTSKVTNMSSMFWECNSLKYLDLSQFKVDNVQTMDRLFQWCSELDGIDVSKWNTSKVTTMYCMFAGCKKLSSIDVTNFDTSRVTNFGSMFSGCTSLPSVDVSNFDTRNGSSFSSMFSSCELMTNIDVSHFDTSNATSLFEMFGYCW